MFSWPPAFFAPKPKKPAAPRTELLSVSHDGAVYDVRIRRNAAARRLILRVRADTGQPVLTLPARTSLATAKVFLARHGHWIAERVARLPAQVPFADGAEFPLRGQACRIVHAGGRRGKLATLPGDTGAPLTLQVPGEADHVPRRVLDHLKAEAKADLAAAVARYAAALGVRVGRLSIKDTKSRWGSCSSTGGLSFSWRLIMAPPFVLDYLAAHEVAHRAEMNHSDRFWRIVADICPEWQAAERWLTAHGSGLHRYGPAGGRPIAR